MIQILCEISRTKSNFGKMNIATEDSAGRALPNSVCYSFIVSFHWLLYFIYRVSQTMLPDLSSCCGKNQCWLLNHTVNQLCYSQIKLEWLFCTSIFSHWYSITIFLKKRRLKCSRKKLRACYQRNPWTCTCKTCTSSRKSMEIAFLTEFKQYGAWTL